MGGAADAPGYDRLSVTERDTLTAVISDLVVLLERKEAAYTAASSQECELGVPRFVLDVSTAPPAVKRWLDREHQ